jgi:creatinine amidohydrolase
MQYAELTHTDIAAHRHKVVVAPIGSLEQHGPHLPLLTDTLIGAEICRRAEEILRDEALFLPMLWCGASDHHRQFPGTVSISQRVYTLMLEDILESLIGSGFRRILLFNAHGGNANPGAAALYNAQLRHRDARDLWLTLGTWFVMAAPQIAALGALETQDHVTHACELETSMILRIRPELARMDAARGASIPFESAF